MGSKNFLIRDPLHGSIEISAGERAIIDRPAFQRLRFIKQLGFADLAFPGATHTRYLHSLGAMHVATRIFKQIFPEGSLPQADWLCFLQALRLAALLHDIGHSPFSHATEKFMPQKREIFVTSHDQAKATHEDFTLKIILDSSLSLILRKNFPEIAPQHIAGLLHKDFDTGFFKSNKQDLGPLLRQIISSEIDADRMDYLLRDSFFCGVNYGKFDLEWLVTNLVPVETNNRVYLGLRSRALFAFEDFLLSRYHMFASVYLHHTSIILEKMLEFFLQEEPDSFIINSNIEKYIKTDDISLLLSLRNSSNMWAQKILSRQPYSLLIDGYDKKQDFDISKFQELLAREKIDSIKTKSRSFLSNYFGKKQESIFMVSRSGILSLLENKTELYQRYQTPAEITRLYVDSEQKNKAQKIVNQNIGSSYA